MRLIVFWSSALRRNSAAVHCLSKAINVCSSVILVFVCAEAIADAIATTHASISIPVSFFISSSPFICAGEARQSRGRCFFAQLLVLQLVHNLRRTSDCFYAVLAAA